MTIQYRIQKYQDETGEYTEYSPTNKEGILHLIQTHWNNENMPNDLKIISLINDSNEILLLQHHHKYVFDAYYLPPNQKGYYHAKSRIEVIFESLNLFIESRTSELKNYLNEKTDDYKFIRGDFYFKDHNYQLKPARIKKEIFWFILNAFLMGGMISFIGFMFLLVPIEHYYLPLLFISAGTYMWLPGVLLHRQYVADAKNLTIRVTSGSEEITLESSMKLTFKKSDLVEVTKYENQAYKIPWSDYGYTELKFRNGRVINITNLLADQQDILQKFNPKICKTKHSRYPKLKAKTKRIGG